MVKKEESQAVISYWSRLCSNSSSKPLLIPEVLVDLIAKYCLYIKKMLGFDRFDSDYGSLESNSSPWAVLFSASAGSKVTKITLWLRCEGERDTKIDFNVFIQQWEGTTTGDYQNKKFVGKRLVELKQVNTILGPQTGAYDFECDCTLPNTGIYALCLENKTSRIIRTGYKYMTNPGKEYVALFNTGISNSILAGGIFTHVIHLLSTE